MYLKKIQCSGALATHDNRQHHPYNMRRRKKDKLTKPASYAEAAASAAAADTLLDNFLHIHHHNTVPTTAAGDSSLTPAVAVAEGVPSSGSLGKISLLAMARSRSPPQQQRRRSGLLGLSGSVRELVEQVLQCTTVTTCTYFRDSFSLFNF